MYFPKFWRVARQGGASAWGWSDASPEAAETEAGKRLQRVIERLAENPAHAENSYGYPDRPMREQVLHEFPASGSAVTRNGYGCLVLNTTTALFADVDESQAPPAGFFASLFGKKEDDFETKTLAEAHEWTAAHPTWGLRVYRTKAGIRLLATHQPLPPEKSACEGLFTHFNVDWLYQKLCTNQQCYRARLTPKPWRCGADRLKAAWPWLKEGDEAAFQEWEQAYLAAAKDYATCRFLGHVGRQEIHPALQELVTFHDEATGATSARELA